MTEVRCKKCRRLFFCAELRDAVIEIKCPRCGNVQKIIRTPKKSINNVLHFVEYTSNITESTERPDRP